MVRAPQASILEYAKRLATAAADGVPVVDCVLVVPAWFSPEQRQVRGVSLSSPPVPDGLDGNKAKTCQLNRGQHLLANNPDGPHPLTRRRCPAGWFILDNIFVCHKSAPVSPLLPQALLDAARLAGLNPMGLIHSHAAAALQYGIERDFTNRTELVAFVDVGATSVEASLVKFSDFTGE